MTYDFDAGPWGTEKIPHEFGRPGWQLQAERVGFTRAPNESEASWRERYVFWLVRNYDLVGTRDHLIHVVLAAGLPWVRGVTFTEAAGNGEVIVTLHGSWHLAWVIPRRVRRRVERELRLNAPVNVLITYRPRWRVHGRACLEALGRVGSA